MYFVLSQQPQQLLQFYVILHICWVFGVELELDRALLGSDFVYAAMRTYALERGPALPLEREDQIRVSVLFANCTIHNYVRMIWLVVSERV